MSASESSCVLEENAYADECMNLGDLRTNAGDTAGAKEAYAEACTKGNQTGCAQK